ncbi:hypothetical protein LTR59_015848 [Friedmanniomyces endolithicus]|nr:hypothetical protein LTR94_018656 [Friedmanniomyces endolithicus]KAK0772023.1 hypothetical protein LTR59_015848 [Friedmanniomyces endolithicus]KAK0779978.1 hypothetical protein LTR38_014243 [Friedmanniomyces endolithicus]
MTMQAANRLQTTLKSGKTAFGGWQMLPGANLSRTIARTPNLDWIETAEALKSVAEIAAVPGVDALLVGPFDLGNSIGHPVLKPEYDVELEEAIMKIHKAAQAAGKWTAIYCGSGASARKYADLGFNMVNTMNDVVALKQGFGGAVEDARGSYVHAGLQGIKQGVEKMTSK